MVQPHTSSRLAELEPADFEQVASLILRFHSPYESLIPCGLNEKGRPIASPTDAVCWIPGTNPPQGVLFAYTSSDRKRLREKWLLDPAEAPRRKAGAREGDVVKALHRAEEIQRREIPQAVLTLVLACTVDPPEKLATEVKDRCLKAGVEVDFWHAARLVNFLDHDPRGQWLRQEFLRIPARRVSWEFLLKLSEKSCLSYAASIFEDATAPHIERELDRRLWEVYKTGRELCFLVSESGFGKSSTALALFRRHLAAGGCGLWLAPDDIVGGISIEGAVEVALRRLQPELLPGCGAEGLKIAVGRQGLMLVADDLSRATAPTNLLLRIASWAKRQGGSEEVHREPTSGWFLLCPIWPRFLSELPETAQEPVQALCLHGGPYSPEEGAAVLQARCRCCGETLTEIEARQLADSLGHDPLLLSLLDLRRRVSWEYDYRPPTLQVIDWFLERQLARLSARQEARYLAASDYKDALLELADRMLVERELAPTWRQIRSWFRSSQDVLDALRQTSADRQIAHLLPEGDEEVLHFRHDRIRDAILASALARSMKNGTLPKEVLDDPFYAELLGQALLMPGIEPILVNRLSKHNPLALFRALQLFEVPHGPFQEAIVRALRKWLNEEVISGHTLDALQWEIIRLLAETNSPLALELCRSFPRTWNHVREVGFRNGDVIAAVTYCARMELGVSYSGFTLLVEHVKARFGNTFTSGLAALLNQSDLPRDQLQGALILAGHLAEQVLFPAVTAAWEVAAEHRIALLAEFLWATLRCLPESETEANRLITPLFQVWKTIFDENPEPSRMPGYYEVVAPLQETFLRRGMKGNSISMLIRRAVDPFEWPITLILNHVDSPDAIEFTVRQAAAGRPGDGSYTSTWEHSDLHGSRLGDASTTRLEELWKASAEAVEVRTKAFHFWNILTKGSDRDILGKLQEVRPTEPFYKEALRSRIRLGDQTASLELIRMTETDEYPSYWWHDTHRIWNELLKNTLDSFLGRLPEDGRAGDWEWQGYHSHTAHTLVEIPAADAEALLIKHWHHLRYRSVFVRAALAVATPRCCELVAEVVRECPDPRLLLEHLHWAYGIRAVGRGQQFGPRQLGAILPYLDLLSEHTIHSLWDYCNEQRWFAFRRRYLDPRLTVEEKRHCGLGREAVFEALDRYLGERWSPWSINHQIESSQKRGESWDDFLRTLLAWLQERRTLKALDIVAHAIIWAGRRADLAELGNIEIEGDSAEARRILERTTFQVFRRRLR